MKNLQPLTRELKVKTLRITEHQPTINEVSTLEDNFSDLDDTISELDEELITFCEVLTVIGYDVPISLKEKLNAVLADKKIPVRNTRAGKSSTEAENFFLAYTFNKTAKEICDSLTGEEVYA